MTSSNGNIFHVTGHLCGEFTGPTQRPVTQSFDVFRDLRLNKRLNKQSWGWWFGSLSPHYDVIVMLKYIIVCLSKCMSQELPIWIFGLDSGESYLGQQPPLFVSSMGRESFLWWPSANYIIIVFGRTLFCIFFTFVGNEITNLPTYTWMDVMIMVL